MQLFLLTTQVRQRVYGTRHSPQYTPFLCCLLHAFLAACHVILCTRAPLPPPLRALTDAADVASPDVAAGLSCCWRACDVKDSTVASCRTMSTLSLGCT